MSFTLSWSHCSIPRRRRRVLHRFGTITPSTPWGHRSCPDNLHRPPLPPGVSPAQRDVDMWATPVHRLWTGDGAHRGRSELSTARPQDGPCCAQLRATSPHLCPLFGKEMRSVPPKSERRHTKGVGWPGENRGISGDGAGEKWPSAVHGVRRTFRSPQKPEVVHRRRPQGRWTKFPP